MAATKEPNIHPTKQDPKQNVIASCNEFPLYFQVLLFDIFQFQLNRNIFHKHDDEIWNLVRTKRQTGQTTTKNSRFILLYLGSTIVHIFPFSSAWVSSENLSKASLFSMNSLFKFSQTIH